MFLRNLICIGLILGTSYSTALRADEQVEIDNAEFVAQDCENQVDDIFGEDDAFADVTIDLNCRPQKLPMWKRAGAWLFVKMYHPIKRVMVWWERRKANG